MYCERAQRASVHVHEQFFDGGNAGTADAAKAGTGRESTCQAQCIGCTDLGRYDLGEGA